MKKIMLLKRMLWLLVFPIFFEACESKLDEHYEPPSWLKGSSWKILEDDGNYTIFLKGIEKGGYRQIMDGKNIMTVMAPDDNAFKAYFAANNINSLEDLSDQEIKKLIGFHLMYYSYNTGKLINFRPEGDAVSEEQAEIGAGMYYKHRTRSADPIEIFTSKIDDQQYKVYHNERYLPVFSYRLFETKKIDSKYNYEYFFPQTAWTGDQSFNVCNAGLNGNEIISGNGYIFPINKVLTPLETIYTELKKNNNYSTFLSLYDQYSYWVWDVDLTRDYGNGDTLYYHKHESPLADIACEWPVSSYSSVRTLSSMSYNIFAPSNEALETFFDSYWKKGGYTKLSEVSDVALQYMLRNCVYSSSSIVFPQEIKEGKVINSQNVLIDFDVDAVPQENRVLCSNGALYKLEELKISAMFNSITGAAFKNKNHSHYLYMLGKSGMAIALSSTEANFTSLIPSNEQVEACGYEMKSKELWDNSEDKALSTSTQSAIVNLHTLTGGDEISFTGTQVLSTNRPWNYWYMKNGKLTTNARFNEIFEASALIEVPDPFVELLEVKNEGEAWNNGKVYAYSGEEAFLPLSTENTLKGKLGLSNDINYKWHYFSMLMDKIGYIKDQELLLGNAIYFIPTNEAFKAAIEAGKIPGVGPDGELIADAAGSTINSQSQLTLYMMRYVIPLKDNGLSGYPYPNSGIQGKFQVPIRTVQPDGTPVYNYTLEIIDDGSKLSVRPYYKGTPSGESVDVVDTYDYFPFAYIDGCVHFLKDVLTINEY